MQKVEAQYNAEYYPYLRSEARYAFLYGGAGSGKSFATAQKQIYRCLQHPGERILVIRNTLRSCRHSTFQLLRDVLRVWSIEAAINRADMAIRFANGSEILHAGLDDVEKLKSIAGITSIWIEEATEVSETDFAEVNRRLRGDVPTYRQITFSFNPISRRHWLKAFMERTEDAFVLHTTWKHNAFLDAEYRRVLEAGDERDRQVYLMGEWGEDLRGLIFTHWQATHERVTEPDAYGLDFGFNHPTALVAIREADPYLHAEEVLYASHLTTPELIEAMEEAGVSKAIPIYCDAARPDQIKELRNAGFAAMKAQKDVNGGIASVQKYRLRIEGTSQNLINELQSYRWAQDRDGQPTDKPVKLRDDACIAAGTLIATHRGGIPIEDVRVGDYALTRKGYRKVVAAAQTGSNVEVMELRAPGVTLRATADHPVWTNTGGFKPIGLWMPCDTPSILQAWQNEKPSNTREFVSIAIRRLLAGLRASISRLLTHSESTVSGTYTVPSMSNTVALSHKGTTFTTSTATRSTTTQAILSALAGLNTQVCTPAMKGHGRKRMPLLLTSTRFAISPQSGTDQRKGLSGTASRPATYTNTTQSNGSASNAAPSTKPRRSQTRDSALQSAGPSSVGIPARTPWMRLVSGVVNHFGRTSTRSVPVVRVPAAQVFLGPSGRADVYNITVEDEGEYFANGVLVHNCDALRYAVHTHLANPEPAWGMW